jgi:DNA-binding transcriptional regulator YiaG
VHRSTPSARPAKLTPMTQPPDFDAAGYVRQASRRTRMNQRKFAAARAVSASTVSRTETGRTPITLASDRSPLGEHRGTAR